MQICQCPGAAALPTLPEMECREDFGQIQRIAFQRIGKAGALNGFPTETPITALESWQTFLQAENDTKVIVTPIIEAPTQDGGDAITFGSGNEVPGGMPRIIGANPTNVSVSLRSFSQEMVAALKQLICEKSLGVYLISEMGTIEALQDKKVKTTYRPIPIQSLFVGDKMHGGFENPDSNKMSFSFPAGYSDSLKIVKPEFNPLIEL